MVCCFPAATEFMYTLRIKPAVASENNKPGGGGGGENKNQNQYIFPPSKKWQTNKNKRVLFVTENHWLGSNFHTVSMVNQISKVMETLSVKHILIVGTP